MVSIRTNQCSMAKIEIENPSVHKTAKVSQQGRVFLTTDLAGERVRVTAERIDDEEGAE